MSQIGVIMGSDSDIKIMEEALKVLRQFEVDFEVIFSSAHRTLERTVDWVKAFEAQGGKTHYCSGRFSCPFTRGCSGGNHLPVIGVPLSSGAMEGIDALYSIVQMPPGFLLRP